MEEPEPVSPKSKHTKPYSPPPRRGPSVTRQAANKHTRETLDFEELMENTQDNEKLPDLVCTEKQPSLNAVKTASEATDQLAVIAPTLNDACGDNFNGIPVIANNVPVTPENVPAVSSTSVTNASVSTTLAGSHPEPVGHDTATTTDEEEAAEALLALCNLTDKDCDKDELDELDNNASMMPIGVPSTSVDVNPIQIKLGTAEVNQVIKHLPEESQFQLPTPAGMSNSKEHSPDTSTNKKSTIPKKGAKGDSSPTPTSPPKEN